MKNIKIENFNGFKVDIEMDNVLKEYSEKCESILKDNSPKGERTHDKYADGWITEKDKKHTYKIWNKTNYQLTHLLENGHIIANKIGGVGWASPVPHIEKSYQQIKQPFISAMEKVDLKIKTK